MGNPNDKENDTELSPGFSDARGGRLPDDSSHGKSNNQDLFRKEDTMGRTTCGEETKETAEIGKTDSKSNEHCKTSDVCMEDYTENLSQKRRQDIAESINDKTKAGRKSYADMVAGSSKTGGVANMMIDDEGDFVLNEEDCIIDKYGDYSTLKFSERIHNLIDRNMEKSVIVRPLVQPWSRSFSTIEKHPSHVIVWDEEAREERLNTPQNKKETTSEKSKQQGTGKQAGTYQQKGKERYVVSPNKTHVESEQSGKQNNTVMSQGKQTNSTPLGNQGNSNETQSRKTLEETLGTDNQKGRKIQGKTLGEITIIPTMEGITPEVEIHVPKLSEGKHEAVSMIEESIKKRGENKNKLKHGNGGPTRRRKGTIRGGMWTKKKQEPKAPDKPNLQEWIDLMNKELNELTISPDVVSRIGTGELEKIKEGTNVEDFQSGRTDMNGGICILWGENVEIEIIQISNQFVHGRGRMIGNKNWEMFTAIYTSPRVEKRRLLWDKLRLLDPGNNASWILGGDFNAILRLEERKVGAPREVFGHIGNKKKRIMEKLCGIEKSLNRAHSDFLLDLEKNLKAELDSVLEQESLWFQKERNKWIFQGGKNTIFFHTSTMHRREKNMVTALKNPDGTWCTNQDQLKEMVINFYKKVFTSSGVDGYAYEIRDIFPKIDARRLKTLIAPVTKEEIKGVVIEMNPWKAPGVDGLHAAFYKMSWPIVGKTVCQMVLDVFNGSPMSEHLNRILIVLIPKVNSPENLSFVQ
ncbi:hypothetical protein F3Y22_tig00110299pilonHSYRG00108 [Hibiscus syriacus]|uniref:Uncharacterized protein n=1 Tax=Hibiscus syriacus TaxID=106335 RepID=A0A6A3B3Z2_HIBSY|nr:hypothetical protein F3Y22_tig00110299pilonHSYRG00108 [Hibiscus syriacus]